MADQALATTEAVIAQKGTIGEDDLSLALDGDRFNQMQRIATVMARGSLLPDHLVVRPYWSTTTKGPIPAQAYDKAFKDLGETAFNQSLKEAEQRTMSNCFRLVNQAFRWRMDPFSIIDKTYSVGDGKLAYEGQLVAAVVNTRGGLRGRLNYEFSGKEYSDDRTIIVSGTFLDEEEPRTIQLSVGRAKTKNEIWRTDPDQKLVYSGSIKWARRWCPELMLGIMTEDDLERMQMRVIDAEAQPGSVFKVGRKGIEDLGVTPSEIPPTAAEIKAATSEPAKDPQLKDPRPKGPAQATLPKTPPQSPGQAYLHKLLAKASKAEKVAATEALLGFDAIKPGQIWKDLPPEVSLEVVKDALSSPTE